MAEKRRITFTGHFREHNSSSIVLSRITIEGYKTRTLLLVVKLVLCVFIRQRSCVLKTTNFLKLKNGDKAANQGQVEKKRLMVHLGLLVLTTYFSRKIYAADVQDFAVFIK